MPSRTSTFFGWLRRRRRWALALLPTLVLFGTSSAACAMTDTAQPHAHTTTRAGRALERTAAAHAMTHRHGAHEHAAADTQTDQEPTTGCVHCGHDHGSAPGTACASGSDLGKAAKSTFSTLPTKLFAVPVLWASATLSPAPPLITRSALHRPAPPPNEPINIRYCVLLI